MKTDRASAQPYSGSRLSNQNETRIADITNAAPERMGWPALAWYPPATSSMPSAVEPTSRVLEETWGTTRLLLRQRGYHLPHVRFGRRAGSRTAPGSHP